MFFCQKVFPMVFVFGSIGKHCSYISFIFFGSLCGPGRGIPPASLLFFVRALNERELKRSVSLVRHILGQLMKPSRRCRLNLVGIVLSKGFLHGFSSMEKHCSYILPSPRLRRASEEDFGGFLFPILPKGMNNICIYQRKVECLWERWKRKA